jgi:hypothetical protein
MLGLFFSSQIDSTHQEKIATIFLCSITLSINIQNSPGEGLGLAQVGPHAM